MTEPEFVYAEPTPAQAAQLDQMLAQILEALHQPTLAATAGLRRIGAARLAYEIYTSARQADPKAVAEAYAGALVQLAQTRLAAEGEQPPMPQWPGDLPTPELARRRVQAFLDDLLELSLRHEMFIRSAITGSTWLQDSHATLDPSDAGELAVNLHWCSENKQYSAAQAADPHDETRWAIPSDHEL